MMQCTSPPERFSLHPLGLARRIPRGPAHGAAIGDEFRLHFARPCPACGSGPRHLRSFPSRDRPPAMQIRNGIVEAIGNTPLIKLEHASELTGCTILGKAEFMNPGQSVKDRAALFIIEDAVKRGALKPGGIIVEGTAGNTGIGLALVANALGYRTVIVIPDTQSQEKKDTLRLCGAELREVPAVPYKDPSNYVHVSERLAKELGAFWANQWDNTANRDGHYRSTGPEIWRQTGGKVDGFTCAIAP